MALPVRQVAGLPATIRVGRVDSVSPFRVSIQGAVLADVGTVAPYLSVGDTVAIVGQPPEQGADPASWLVLGRIESVARPAQEAGNFVSGRVSIVPVPSVPTAAVVTGFDLSGSGTPHAVVTAGTSVPGSTVVEVSHNGVTSTQITVVIYRTNATPTNVDFMIHVPR